MLPAHPSAPTVPNALRYPSALRDPSAPGASQCSQCIPVLSGFPVLPVHPILKLLSVPPGVPPGLPRAPITSQRSQRSQFTSDLDTHPPCCPPGMLEGKGWTRAGAAPPGAARAPALCRCHGAAPWAAPVRWDRGETRDVTAERAGASDVGAAPRRRRGAPSHSRAPTAPHGPHHPTAGGPSPHSTPQHPSGAGGGERGGSPYAGGVRFLPGTADKTFLNVAPGVAGWEGLRQRGTLSRGGGLRRGEQRRLSHAGRSSQGWDGGPRQPLTGGRPAMPARCVLRG